MTITGLRTRVINGTRVVQAVEITNSWGSVGVGGRVYVPIEIFEKMNFIIEDVQINPETAPPPPSTPAETSP